MRLFLGTLLSPDNQIFFNRAVSRLAGRRDEAIRPIPSDSAHVTYAFTADLDERHLDPLMRAVAREASAAEAIEFSLGLPHVVGGSRPRLVIADLAEGVSAVGQLSEGVLRAAQSACPEASWSPARTPHVTLARFRKHARAAEARSVTRDLTDNHEFSVCPDRITAVQLIASRLTPRGPVYEVRAACDLRSR